MPEPTPPKEDSGSLPLSLTDPAGANLYATAGGPLGPAPAMSPGGWGAVGSVLGNIGQALYEAGPGTLEKFWSGQLQPGTPEAEEAARSTALTYGLPGGAPAGTLSAGARLGRGAAAKAAEVAAPAIGKGSEAPLFDYSQLAVRPNVPQVDLPRYQMPTGLPPKGVPAKFTTAMENPENRARFTQMVERGRKPGEVWYGTRPLLDAFMAELGPELGPHAYQRYLEYVGATSPRSAVGQNVRNASYYFGQERRGEPVIETVRDPGRAPALVGNLPKPYGHIAQRLHVQNVRNLRGMDPVGPGVAVRPPSSILGSGFPILTNPKPPSFAANLLGNWRPVTADVHNVRAWGLGDIPGQTGYGYMEDVQQELAKQLGMDPAQLQAAGWVGGEMETGVRSGPNPFLRHFEDRVRETARIRGETPQDTMRKFLRGEADLLQAGDISSMIGSAAAQAQGQGQGDERGP